MAKFKYVAIDLKGKSLSGEIEADDSKKAKRLIRAEGVTPLKVTKIGGSEKKGKPAPALSQIKKGDPSKPSSRKLGAKGETIGLNFLKRLMELHGSGMPVADAVKLLNQRLSDPKLKRFCDSFPTQWLQLDRIISSVPDEKTYPDFYYAPPSYRTTMDMMMEPLLLFETVLLEDRPVLDFIDANYTYRSARLRKWLGEEPGGKIGGPVTMQFSRQALSDRRQGGMITNSAVMTMTSGPHETKPITRGAWLAGVIFNSPPPPPPADVPPLPKVEKKDEGLTLRQRFSAHRERADCAGCHEKLDPLGFALENFDPVGRWRDDYDSGLRVDSEGVLFRRHEFGDVIEFKDAILKEKDRFVRALAGHMLAFALGRELAPADSPALDEIAQKASTQEYRMKALIKAVVQSEPFLGKSTKLALQQKPSKP